MSSIEQKEAFERAEAGCFSIGGHWAMLRAILGRHEEVIRRRWTKKSQTHRRTVLLKAWPSMPALHRPDLAAFRRMMTDRNFDSATCREAFMWPYINLEDLSSGVTILTILHSRGRHGVNLFADIDLDCMRIGLRSGALPQEKVLADYEMDLRSDFGSGYGSISPRKPSKTASTVTNTHSQQHSTSVESTGKIQARVFGASEGLHVLEVQEKILDFLISFCTLTLHDKDLHDRSLPVLPDPKPLSVQHEGEYFDASSLARQAPYSTPRHIDLAHLRSLIQERCSDALDRFFALREDPGYFAEISRNFAEHSFQQLLDTERKPHPEMASSSGRRAFWDRTVAIAILDSYEEAHIWLHLKSSFERVAVYEASYARTGGEPSQNFINQVEVFRHLLDHLAIPRLLPSRLQVALSASPLIRPLVTVQRLDSSVTRCSSAAQVFISARSNTELRQDDLLFLCEMFNNDYIEIIGLETLCSELQRLMQDKAYRGRITSTVTELIADLSILGEIRNQLRIRMPDIFAEVKSLHGPADDRLGSELWYPILGLGSKCVPPFQHGKMRNVLDTTLFLRLGEYGNPTCGKLRYPIGKRRTQETVQAMQVAEANLDEMWMKFEAFIKTHLDEQWYWDLREKAERFLVGMGEFQRTPDWIESRAAASPLTMDLLSIKDENRFQPSFPHGSDPAQVSTAPSSRKVKEKTRKEPAEPHTEPAPEEKVEPELHAPLFLVKRRVYKVFATLFHSSNSRDQAAGEVPWVDFLHAMVAVGFTPEKLYGSVWRFAPRRGGGVLGVEQAINFHGPHPEVKLAFWTARRYGRRLTKKYGLEGSMFVLDEG